MTKRSICNFLSWLDDAIYFSVSEMTGRIQSSSACEKPHVEATVDYIFCFLKGYMQNKQLLKLVKAKGLYGLKFRAQKERLIKISETNDSIKTGSFFSIRR